MGAWGFKGFENDDAMDWVAQLKRDNDFSILEAAFKAVLHAEGEYLEMPQCANAIAAAEVVAAMLGRPCPKVPDAVLEWVRGKPSPAQPLVALAVSSIKTVLAGSELQEVWADSGGTHWLEACAELQKRLAGV